jgi:hypothetical protein
VSRRFNEARQDHGLFKLYLYGPKWKVPPVTRCNVIGDGAEWIWNLADPCFPGAVQIVDLFHARQHLWELVRRLYPSDEVNQEAWIKVHQRRLLDKGKIERLVCALRSIASFHPVPRSPKRFASSQTIRPL